MTRFGYAIVTYVASLGFSFAALFSPAPKLIWNASASVPIGLYAVHPASPLFVTELVVVQPPDALAGFLDERRYLPKGIPMLKRVLALPGQTVCRTGRIITVDGVAMGDALDRDSHDRLLPVWQGCHRIADGDVFLMNWQSADSFDGRYFGPLPVAAIIGRAALDRGGVIVQPDHPSAVASSCAPMPNPFSFPAGLRHVTCRPHIAAIAGVIAVIMSVTVVSHDAVSAEPTPATAPVAGVSTTDPFVAFVDEAAQRFAVPASWIRAVMRAESAGDTHAVSPKGAMGLMQIMPQTWADLRARYGLGANPYDPHDNILAGAAYLRELYDRYGVPGLLGAYNAGPGRYEEHLASGRPLPAETQVYVATVAPTLAGAPIGDTPPAIVATHSWATSPLFAGHSESQPTDRRSAFASPSDRLSIDRAVEDRTALTPLSSGLFVRTSTRKPQP